MRILAVCGSLRADSTNIRLLRAISILAPTEWSVVIRPPLDDLPYFNPDIEESGPPPSAIAWRSQIRSCDVLIISSPEYAHGVPGVLKNALDWLVGGTEIVGKPIALLNASPPATMAHASLIDTLSVMGGVIVPEASIAVPLRGSKLSPDAIASDPTLARLIGSVLSALSRKVTGLDQALGRPE